MAPQNGTFLQRVYDFRFPTKYQRFSHNVAFLKSFSFICTEKWIFDIAWYNNQKKLPVFWRQIRQGCGLITFSVGNQKTGVWYLYDTMVLKNHFESTFIEFLRNRRHFAKFLFQREKARVEILNTQLSKHPIINISNFYKVINFY